jgi:hypothetical protein
MNSPNSFDYNFGNTTDTFLTGCIIGCTLKGKSKIFGIAN